MTKMLRPVLALLLAGAAMPVHAAEIDAGTADADAAAAEAPGGAGEIVVTGMKFDRTLQDTPESVKVYTSEEIERQNLVSIYDLIDRTANVSSTLSKSGFNIRGISNKNVSGYGFGTLATVYLDGSPLPSEAAGGGPLDLWDLDQVEILRGPQSTLQGRNALAGAIILKTADPSFDWHGKARAMITDADSEYRLAAAVGGPIVDDRLAFRIAGELARGDGFIKNRFAGGNYARTNSEAVRAKLLFTPTGADGIQIKLSYLYDRHFGNDGRGYTFSDVPDAWDDRHVEANRPTYNRMNTDLGTLDISLPLGGGFTLSSVSTYSHIKTFSIYDGDLRREDVSYGDYTTNQKTFSQEARLTFDTGALQGLIGGYYSRLKNPDTDSNSTFSLHLDQDLGLTNQVTSVLVSQFGLPLPAAQALARQARQIYPDRVFISSQQLYSVDIETMALFGDANWEVAPGLKLLAGFRYDRERQKVANSNSVVLNTVIPNPADYASNPTLAMIIRTVNGLLQAQVDNANSSGPESTTTYKAFLPKGGVSFEFAPDKTVSAIVQRGYRSGGSGVNPGRATTHVYDPEYTWNYELSLRTQWLDRRLTFNANAFYVDWTDQQVYVQLSDNVYDYETQNAGSSRVWGFEVESDFDVTERLNIYGSAGYANSKFLDFQTTNGVVQDLSGRAFANAPRWTWAAGLDWRHPSGFSANFNVNYRGAQYQNLREASAKRDLPARTLVNAKIGWANDNVGAYLVATNIFDEKYFDYQYENAGRLQALFGEPRTIGLTFEGRF
jgi:outer membrane receptor protein involved in Fe transport